MAIFTTTIAEMLLSSRKTTSLDHFHQGMFQASEEIRYLFTWFLLHQAKGEIQVISGLGSSKRTFECVKTLLCANVRSSCSNCFDYFECWPLKTLHQVAVCDNYHPRVEVWSCLTDQQQLSG
uniref:Uncharacterized protein n=1 Tax=Pygocentrus nattereri TaxID=42514 RepID=A0AAR2LG91_PYGNA